MNTPHCAVCNDTGKLPGSDYLDCTHCDAAAERTALENFAYDKFGGLNDADDRWAIHQRASQIEREAQAARIAELEEAVQRAHAALAGGRPDASAEVKKLAAVFGAAPSAPAVEQAQHVAVVKQGQLRKYVEYRDELEMLPVGTKLYTAPLATDTDKVRDLAAWEALRTILEGTRLDEAGNRNDDGMRDYWDGSGISKQLMARWIAVADAAILQSQGGKNG